MIRLRVGDSSIDVTNCRMERSLRSTSGSFRATLPGSVDRRLLKPGAGVVVLDDEWRLLTGYVDAFEEDVSGGQSSVEISGRDATQDLVDSTPVIPTEWHQANLKRIATDVCRPHGLSVAISSYGRREIEDLYWDRFAILEGERAWQVLERACRQRGILMFPSTLGALALERPSGRTADVDLVEGVNLVSYSIHRSHANRYSIYWVRGQRPGSDEDRGIAIAAPEASAVDLGVERYRPLVVLAESSIDEDSAKARAQWEASVRAARSATIVATVHGLRQSPDKRPWTINEIVKVLIPSRAVDAAMLVESVAIEYPPETTTLTLVRQGSYLPSPEVSASDNPFQDNG